ncbi:MAG: hypothetical protein IT279_08985 [Ignavibacteriaceae bacterium]|nr:hypothetical protein [Ignavibacteriaceae bacterium]
MTRFFIFLCAIGIITSSLSASGTERLDTAFSHAKKGLQYGLSNLKEKRSKDEYKLIEQDKLLAEVKISKEIGGVKIESKGFFEGEEVTVVTYRSYESLVSDGYIDKNSDLLK